ncbi:MAG: carbon-nitrogen hydrolase family protein [Candidatus Heimdallarchaeota archaeon]
MVRIGVVQWQMRDFESLEEITDKIASIAQTAKSYAADFLLLPEYFNAPLMAHFNQKDAIKAIRKLVDYTETIREKLVQLALENDINIIGGSLPYYENEELTNTSFLCQRNGTWEVQKKIHITPSEKATWGIVGANKIQVFNTDVAKIGILICYDVEFPELSRILAQNGMQILFVPFATDTKRNYQRVRICAQARAIENECYVAIAGSVGFTPRAKNMEMHYAQSAIFSPSDFSFPHDAVVVEGTINKEMLIIGEINLELLERLHCNGSVTNLKDRRTDVYEIKLK